MWRDFCCANVERGDPGASSGCQMAFNQTFSGDIDCG